VTRGFHAPRPAGGLTAVQTAILHFCDSGLPCPSTFYCNSTIIYERRDYRQTQLH